MKIDKRKKYSLALGGGAARGLAHIGALKYLEKNNIKISEVSGTSMGAIVGSLYATGLSAKQIEKFALDLNIFKCLDFDLKKGVIGGDKIIKKLEEKFGDKKIENTKIPLKIVATNLKTGNHHVFKKGLIKDALRASMSLPGILKPQEINGKMYIDGGVCCNLPIQVLSGEHVIAVSALKKPDFEIKLTKSVLGVEFNRGFLPVSYEILHKTVVIMMAQNEESSLKTKGKNILFFRPDFGDYDYYSFHKTHELIELGYNTIKNKLKGKNK